MIIILFSPQKVSLIDLYSYFSNIFEKQNVSLIQETHFINIAYLCITTFEKSLFRCTKLEISTINYCFHLLFTVNGLKQNKQQRDAFFNPPILKRLTVSSSIDLVSAVGGDVSGAVGRT